jgi:hypothetical protein
MRKNCKQARSSRRIGIQCRAIHIVCKRRTDRAGPRRSSRTGSYHNDRRRRAMSLHLVQLRWLRQRPSTQSRRRLCGSKWTARRVRGCDVQLPAPPQLSLRWRPRPVCEAIRPVKRIPLGSARPAGRSSSKRSSCRVRTSRTPPTPYIAYRHTVNAHRRWRGVRF